jgi:hypothetical protein
VLTFLIPNSSSHKNKFCRASVEVCQILLADFGAEGVERKTFVQG